MMSQDIDTKVHKTVSLLMDVSFTPFGRATQNSSRGLVPNPGWTLDDYSSADLETLQSFNLRF